MFLCDAEDSSCARQKYLAQVLLEVQAEHPSLVSSQAPLVVYPSKQPKRWIEGLGIFAACGVSSSRGQPVEEVIPLQTELLHHPLGYLAAEWWDLEEPCLSSLLHSDFGLKFAIMWSRCSPHSATAMRDGTELGWTLFHTLPKACSLPTDSRARCTDNAFEAIGAHDFSNRPTTSPAPWFSLNNVYLKSPILSQWYEERSTISFLVSQTHLPLIKVLGLTEKLELVKPIVHILKSKLHIVISSVKLKRVGTLVPTVGFCIALPETIAQPAP
ncbi:hypothetical protein AV530_007649 [Patagioenas fasciata monilis]|uniref:Uncharacterized protein n=1 Tax=Patagioenas fasciata monilis TaxID=372326 RepID=A0A1V4JYS4_PATFA|nr:hypothetical protein AV530_007649 [Patagioenas fasciata monilis]